MASVAAYLPETGFGQVTVKVSPIEMATLAAAVGMAGSGTAAVGAARPVWVEKVTDTQGRDVRLTGMPGMAAPADYRPFTPEVLLALHSMMLGVVNTPGGTAYRAFHTPGGEPRLPGIEIGSHVNGRNLDDPRVVEVFTAAQDLGAAIFVHPWDMLGRELLVRFQTSPKHPLRELNKAYRKF